MFINLNMMHRFLKLLFLNEKNSLVVVLMNTFFPSLSFFHSPRDDDRVRVEKMASDKFEHSTAFEEVSAFYKSCEDSPAEGKEDTQKGRWGKKFDNT